jgi:hypothetical protein
MHLHEAKEDKKATIKKLASDYAKDLDKYKISDEVVSKAYKFKETDLLVLLIGLVAFIPGLLINCLPILISRYLSKKRVYVKEFYAPVLYASSTFFLLIWYITLQIIGLIWIGTKSISLLFSVYMAGYFSILFMENIKKLVQRFRYKRLSTTVKNDLNNTRLKLTEFIKQ